MALDYDKVDVSTGLNTATRLNAELEKIETALTDGLSRSGNGPNAMSADLDMGNNDILNAGAVQCDSILVGGQTITSVAALAAEADRAETAATGAGAAQAAAEAAAATINLPAISPGDAGRALIVNVAEDGYDHSALADPDTAITARLADQTQAEAGVDNSDLMTPLRTAQAIAISIATLAEFYTGTDEAYDAYPLGTVLFVKNLGSPDRNSTVTVYRDTSRLYEYHGSSGGGRVALTGTWRVRGVDGGKGIVQRVA